MKNIDLKLPSNKSFGLFFTFIFIGLSFVLYQLNNFILTLISFLISQILLIITILRPNYLTFLNKCWMVFGLMLGKITTPIIIGIIFYILISPISIILRLFGRDELNLVKDKNASSYWKNMSDKNIYKSSFTDQF
mgnify:CR=1 FL=1|jgi:hypothetical protein|tara:strand:- start:4679 stop:5083 length:405 start_codon:yes stop_codon:yes gene_type:complete